MFNDPFWGLETVRATMRRGGRGPTWGLLVLGAVLLAVGVGFSAILLAVIGALTMLVGVWPLVAGIRGRRQAERLAEHAHREDEILASARAIVNEASGTSDGRGGLAALIAADPPAADVARQDCLRRAARAQGEERDAWLDAANEIGHLTTPERISR